MNWKHPRQSLVLTSVGAPAEILLHCGHFSAEELCLNEAKSRLPLDPVGSTQDENKKVNIQAFQNLVQTKGSPLP